MKGASNFCNVFGWCEPLRQLSSWHHVSSRCLNTNHAQARSQSSHQGGLRDLSQQAR